MKNILSKKLFVKIKITTCFLISCLLLLTSCAPSVDPADIYHHTSDYKGDQGARNIEVWQAEDGTLSARGLGDDANIPATMSLGLNDMTYYIEALNSQNIQIAIKNTDYTQYAGLKWTQAVTVNIWSDGIIEVKEEGITAQDTKGISWVSKKVSVSAKRAIIMVRKK